MIDKPTNIGVKFGSQNLAIAYRKEPTDEITFMSDKTCIMYPTNFLKTAGEKPLVGIAAEKYADVKYPLRLGVVDKEEGAEQLADILRAITMPITGRIVMASPAVQIREGNERLARAIRAVCLPYGNILLYSEGLCAAVQISGVQEIRKLTFYSLNLGSTTTEIALYNMGEIVHMSAHSEVSGNKIDERAQVLVTNALGDAVISTKEIRVLKEQINLNDPKPMLINAMTSGGIIEKEILAEILNPITEYANRVAGIFCDEVFKTINDNTARNAGLRSPIYISGGMSNITGLPEMIAQRINEKMNHEFELKKPENQTGHIAPALGALLIAEAIGAEENQVE